MKIIALEKELPEKTAEEFQPHLVNETKEVIKLYEEGIIREIYFREDKNEAVLILECANINEANNYLGKLPLVANKLIEFEIIPLKPYPGFSRLL